MTMNNNSQNNKERLNEYLEELKLLGKQIKSLKQTGTDVVKQLDVALFEGQDKQKERLIICKECDSYVKNRDMCKECGCIMSMKTRLFAAKCPLGKW